MRKKDDVAEKEKEEDKKKDKTETDPEIQTLDYKIKGGVITETVLNNYLDRAITESEYLNSSAYNTDGYYGTAEDKRMLLNIGAKFVGRAMYTWGGEQKFTKDAWFNSAKAKIDEIHAVDPDVIFQAALFEIVSKNVNQVPIPEKRLRTSSAGDMTKSAG